MLRRLPSFALVSLFVLACSASDKPETQRSIDGNGAAAAGGGAKGGAVSTAESGRGGTPGGASNASGGMAASGAPNGGAALVPGGSSSSGGSLAGGGTGAGGASSGGTLATGGVASPSGGTAGVPLSGGAPVGGALTTGGVPSSSGAANLGDKYASYFPIGAAVDSKSYMTHAPLLTRHFKSITPENEMKFESLQPTQGMFTYAAADRIVDFAQRSNMKIRGHALVWHSQNPSWLFSNGSGGTVSREVLLGRMKDHIDNVAGHFRGKVYAWDVVNEAMMDGGVYRTGNEAEGQVSRWYEIIGESYIAEAFRYAHAADPDAKLFYNDFYDYIPAKQQGIYEMLKKLLADGVPVHGVGMQCHLNIEPSTVTTNQAFHQTVANLEKAIDLYSSLGLEVQVTELDVSLYIPGMMYTEDTFYTAAKFTDALKAKQAARYREFFELFRRRADVITGVTFWGIADDNTWLSEFDSGRKDFPLLFDDDHQPKPAYDAVVQF